ncbi:RHS domain-containing protein, partial [Desulfuromonas acetoxidans]
LKTLSNSGTVSDYLYDGNSLRVVKDNDGVITHYHYDLQGRLLAETDSDGTLQRAVVWYGDTPAALIDIEQSEPTFYTCTTTESFTDAVGPGMTIDTAAHSIVIQDGDYAGTYAISDEDWQVYPTAIVFSWRGGGVEFQGGLYPDYELPRRSGGLIFYEDDDEGNSQIADIYKVWKQSEGGSSTIATRYQVHTDQIGAPVLLTDATGTAVWSAQYAPSVKPQSTAMSTATAPMSCATCASPASTLTRNPVCITIGIATMNHGLGGILPWIRLGWMEGMLICMLMWEMAHSTGLIHLA